MNRRFVMRAAVGMVAVMGALVVLESQADACFKRLKRSKGCCEAACEPSCGAPVEVSCAAPEPSCRAPEPSCCAPEPSCCAPEPSCGYEASCDSGCKKERRFKLFGGRRNKCGGCEPSCCAVEVSCGVPSDDGAGSMDEPPPAPEGPSA